MRYYLRGFGEELDMAKGNYRGWELFSTRKHPFKARRSGRSIIGVSADNLKAKIDALLYAKKPTSGGQTSGKTKKQSSSQAPSTPPASQTPAKPPPNWRDALEAQPEGTIQAAVCGHWSVFHENGCSSPNWIPKSYKGWAIFSTRTNPFEAKKDGQRLVGKSPADLKRLIDNAAGGKQPQGDTEGKVGGDKESRPPAEDKPDDATPDVSQPSIPHEPTEEKKKPNLLLLGGLAAAGVAAVVLMK